MKVNVDAKTSSPFLIPSTLSARCMAAVAFTRANAFFVPVYSQILV